MAGRIGERAVVLGGGIAGLLAARVLAGRYGEIVVIERDDPPVAPAPRRGATHGRHAHALLAGGQLRFEELLPGFTAGLVDAGVPVGDVTRDVRMYVSGYGMCRAPSGLVAVSASRPLLEHHLRRCVAAVGGVRITERCDAVGLELDAGETRVVGVHLLPRADGSTSEVLEADLVVDATGRSSRTPAWLEAHGFERPREERVELDVAYATRRYRAETIRTGGDMAVLQAPTPTQPRGGVLARIEDGLAMLTLTGVLGDRPPTDPEGFDRFASSLDRPDIPEAIAQAEPVDDPVPYRFPASIWRRYDKLRWMPEGLIVMGDGMCSLNPIYGQGMSTAAIQASMLARHLARRGRLRSRRLRAELARQVAPAWQMAAGADLAFPGAGGRRTTTQRVVGRYVARLHRAAATSPRVAVAAARVTGLVDPPGALLRPSIACRVFAPRAPG